MHRLIQIGFHRQSQHKAHHEGRARPAEAAHQQAEQAHAQQQQQIRQFAVIVEGAEADHHHHEGRQQPKAHRGQPRNQGRCGKAQQGAHDIRDGKRPDDRIGQIKPRAHQRRPGFNTKQRHAAQEHRHGPGRRNAEEQGRHQRTTFAGVIRCLHGNHAAHITLAELAVLFGLNRVPIDNPIGHAAAKPRDRAQHRPNRRCTQQQPPMAHDIAHTINPTATQIRRARNRPTTAGQINNLRQRENRQHQHGQRQTIRKIDQPEIQTIFRRGRCCAHHAKRQTHAASNQALGEAFACQHAHHGKPKQRQHEQLGRAKRQNQGPRNQHRACQNHRANQPANHGSQEGCR